MPHDRLMHSLFWFVPGSAAEEEAIGAIRRGEYDRAREILGSVDSWSATLNRHTLALMEGNLKGALNAMARLAGPQRADLLRGLSLETLDISESELLKDYFAILRRNVAAPDLTSALQGVRRSAPSLYAALGNELTGDAAETLDRLVAASMLPKGSTPEEYFAAGQKLIDDSRAPLAELKALGTGNPTAAMTADKVANRILQCAIDAFNSAKAPGWARKVRPMAEYALSVAVGDLARGRCQENIRIIKDVIASEPPEEIAREVKRIREMLDEAKQGGLSIEKAENLLWQCRPLLAEIKEKVGFNHPAAYAIGEDLMSGILNDLIAIVNNTYPASDRPLYQYEIKRVAGVVKKAYTVVLMLEKLPMHGQAKEWFERNRASLYNVLVLAGDPSYKVPDYYIWTDDDQYTICETADEYRQYLKAFPNGKHRDQAQAWLDAWKSRPVPVKIKDWVADHKAWSLAMAIAVGLSVYFGVVATLKGAGVCLILWAVVFLLGGIFTAFGGRSLKKSLPTFAAGAALLLSGILCNQIYKHQENDRKEARSYNLFMQAPSYSTFDNYASDFGRGRRFDQVLNRYATMLPNEDITNLGRFTESYPDLAVRYDVGALLEAKVDSLYWTAEIFDSPVVWQSFIDRTPRAYQRDAAERLQECENRIWRNERTAWATALEMGTKAGFEKYLEFHPHGDHANEAGGKIADIVVDENWYRTREDLPRFDRAQDYDILVPRGKSMVGITNETGSMVTVYLKGPSSRRVILENHQSEVIYLTNGEYQCMANVIGSGYFRMRQELTGGAYEAGYTLTRTVTYR